MSTLGRPVPSGEHARLYRDVWALRTAGHETPCAGPDRALWLSDSAADRRRAVPLCDACPVFDQCDAAAVQTGEPFGVWAGIDRGPYVDADANNVADRFTKRARGKRRRAGGRGADRQSAEEPLTLGPLAGSLSEQPGQTDSEESAA